MIILGLTGSIGMGKSTIADNFRRLGIPIHDADETVHDLLKPNGEAFPPIKEMFPEAVKKGAIDRDIIAAKMTAEQIGEAQRRAREWNEAHPREP